MAGGRLGNGHRERMVTVASVTLHNLTVSYRQHPALHHVSGVFAQGSLTAVIGPNGAGKSTLLKSIAGLLPASQHSPGSRLEVHTAPGQLAYLPQQSEIERGFPMRVRDCVMLGCGASRVLLAQPNAPRSMRPWTAWACRVLPSDR